MPITDQLDVFLRARYTLLLLVTREEERAIQALLSASEKSSRQCISWDSANQFTWLSPAAKSPLPNARDPLSALEQIEKYDPTANVVFILRDFHEMWNNPVVKRKLRNLANDFRFNRKSIVITSPILRIPEELRNDLVAVEFPLPTSSELEAVLNTLTSNPAIRVNLTALGREKLIRAALGLTAAQAQRVFSAAIVGSGVSTLDDRDIDLVTSEKRRILLESEALEFFPAAQTSDDVGGLSRLKSWLRTRESAFTNQARAYGLPVPKGIALIGIPGTGKSLTAKMVAGMWHLPLIRLDVGALFGSLVGESEERTRRALRLAETMAPCILWIDELEKSLAHGGLDSGTSTRVFGSILTWMQEKTAECFIVATANDISSLPPELLRRGRFDEIFFLDLPSYEERREIFSVHLQKRRRLVQDFDISLLAARADGYTGAEIEQAVVDAMYEGFAQDEREFTTQDILDALSRLVPLSISQKEVIRSLRSWLNEGRAQSASANMNDADPSFSGSPVSLDL